MTDYSSLINMLFTVLNSLFENVFSSIDSSVYNLLDDITFINPSILEDSFFKIFLDSSSKNTILLVSNALIICLLIYYGIQYFFSHFSNMYIDSPFQFIFKLIILAIVMNFSYDICQIIVFIISTISAAIRELGELSFQENICFSSLVSRLNDSLFLNTEGNSLELFSLDSIIKGFTSFGFISLLFTYSIRYIYINILIIFSPFAFLSLSLNTTSWIFKSWFRNFVSLLLVQVFISIILLIFFSLNPTSSSIYQLLYIGLLYALIQINSFVKELFGGISFNMTSNIFTSKLK